MHDKRNSGISLVGDLTWGTHFCQFYQTKKDLLDVLIPYFRAGLEGNEFCVWVTSALLGVEDAKKALKKAVPHFEKYAKNGQIEIISQSRWHALGEKSGSAVVSRLDHAVSSGFDGLRLACNAFSEKKAPLVKAARAAHTVKKRSSPTGFACYGADVISRHNVIGVFTYPRDKFDAIGLMEVVKNHRFALVRNAGRWEVIESSEARIVKDELKRSEEKLHSLFSNMSEGFAYHRVVLNSNGKPCDYIFLEVNEAFERLTGLKGKNIIGKRVTEALPGIEKDPTDWIGKYGKVALTGKPVQFESYSEALKKWFSISAFSPHKGHFAVTFSDITERKKTEQALRESEEHLNRSQEIAHLGSWELDLVNNRLSWSDEVYRIFGLRPQEFGATYEAFLEAVHPDDRAAVDAAYSGSLREGRDAYDIEHRVVRKPTGEVRIVHEKCGHIRDGSGRIIRSVGMVHDITGRKRAEDSLLRSSRRFEILSEAAGRLLASERPQEVVNDLCSKVMSYLDCHAFFNFLVDEKKGRLHLNACAGIPEKTAREIEWLDYGVAVCGCAARDGERIVCENIPETPDPRTELVRSFGIKAYACHPLLSGKKVIGTLSFGTRSRRSFNDEDLSLMKIVADQVSVAMERMRAKEELESRVRERTTELAETVNTLQTEVSERLGAEEKVLRLNRLYSVLSKINEAIVRIHDPEILYERVCRVAVEDGLFKMAWIGLTDPETLMVKPVAKWGDSGGYLDHIRIYAADVSEGRGPTGAAVLEGTYSICGDIEHDPRMLPWRDKALRHGFRSSAAFPLRAGSVVIGALTIYSDTPQFFTDDEINLLNSLVDDVSFAIDFMANEKKRLEAEAALRLANAYNRSLIEASLDPLVTIDTGGKITDVNVATETVTGLSREDLVGTDFSDYFTDPDSAMAGYQQVFLEGSVKDYPLEIRHKEKGTTPVLYNATVYRDETGKVLGVFAAARDITERRETERRITVTNDLLKLFTPTFSRKEYLDSAMKIIREWSGCRYVGMRIADRDGNIPYEACAGFSPEFLESERVLSLKRDQCACTRVVMGAPEPQDMPAMTRAGSFHSNNTMKFVEDLTDEQKARFRGVCIRSGFASVAVVPIRYRDKVLGAVHLADEREGMVPLKNVEFIEQLALIIGEAVFRFGIEEEIWKLNRELEQRVIERTTQLEAANKELEAFSYSVSHDLRAPLRIIDGFSQAIEEEQAAKLDETGKDYFQRVRAASRRMAQLIDALLSLSRQTRGELNRTTVDMSSLAKAAADDLRKTQPDRRVEFVIADAVAVPGDPVMLRAALENLLGNAWKFTEKRDPARIEFGVTRKEGQDVYFVRDNGAGFDMNYANKLFTAFQRLHSTSEFPGLGIGLATVQRIVHRHGGRIWAEGEVDKGATFYFIV